MARSKPINALPIEPNPQLSGYTIYEDGVRTSIIKLETLLDVIDINRISGDTELYNLITGETSNRISGDTNLDLLKFDKSGGTITGNIIVNGTITGDGSGITGLTIGAPEDGSYDDGIFKDFNNNTKVGIAVDRFNEMFLKLAPEPPMEWNLSSLILLDTSYSGRKLSTSENVNFIINKNTTYGLNIPSNGITGSEEGIITVKLNNNIIETCDVLSTNNKTTGIIRYSYNDPYFGLPGKSGFWNGFTSFNLNFNNLTPNNSLNYIELEHSIKGRLIGFFYLDEPLLTSISNFSCVMPEMNGVISGIKTLSKNQIISNISFTINNVSSYFYNNSNIWFIENDLVLGQNGDIDNVPLSYGDSGIVTDKSTYILQNKFSNNNFNLTVKAKNSIGNFGNSFVFINSNYRVDTVSNETERLTSGTGLYPTTFGSTFDSSQKLNETYINELMLMNGSYSWPIGNYTSFDSPDYSNIMFGDNIDGVEYRWATFNLGNKSTPVNNITLTIPNATIGSSWNAIKFYVKIGDSGWLDGSVSQSVAAPYNNGDGALDIPGSTSYYVRKITFGTVPRSGTVYVRIGISSANTTYKFKKPTIN